MKELKNMNCRAQKWYNPELLDSPLICQLYQKANNPFLIYVLMYSTYIGIRYSREPKRLRLSTSALKVVGLKSPSTL